MNKDEIYFKTDIEWRTWLANNYHCSKGVYLIFYKIETKMPSMRWEEAVKVALCYGWIDSTVKRLGEGKPRQYFCPRKPKSVWSRRNKTYIEELTKNGLMHQSGLSAVEIAQENGAWTTLDDVENLVIPKDLNAAFDQNKTAFVNYQNFAPSYRKNYLYWLHQVKRSTTRMKRIQEIIDLCAHNKKSKGGAF